jgi:hypothetical protein
LRFEAAQRDRLFTTTIRLLAAAVLLTVVINGCSSLRVSSPAAGAPGTYRVEAPPFRFSTNFAVDRNDPVVQGLVALRAEVGRTLELPLGDQTIEIYIFDDRPTYQRFFADYYPDLPPRRAFFVAQADRSMVYTFRGDRLDEDLRHEVCHALVHSAVRDIPLWLDEGLAEYFESPPAAGGLHARHLAELRSAILQGWHPSLTRLEAFTQVSQMSQEDYREAWAWVHFLLHGSPEHCRLLLVYLEELRAGLASEPLSSRLFRGLPRADAAIVRHLTQLRETIPPAAATVPRQAGTRSGPVR